LNIVFEYIICVYKIDLTSIELFISYIVQNIDKVVQYILIFEMMVKNMKTLTSSEARQGFSSLLSTIEMEPVLITKDSKNVAVLITDTRYKELERIEDILYAAAADLAIKEGFAPKEEADELLNSLTTDK